MVWLFAIPIHGTTAMAMSTEDAIARFTDLDARYNAMANRLASVEAEHQQAHSLLEAARAQIATHQQNIYKLQTSTGAGGKFEFRLIDPKTMVPEKLAGRNQWRAWSEASRSYIENLDTAMAEHLQAVECVETALTPSQIAESQITEEHAKQLGRYLKLRTESSSHAHSVIKAAQEKKLHPLEQWRLLSREYDPKGLGSEFVEMQELMAPEKLRAQSVAGISAAIEAWEDMERRHKKRNGLELPEKLRTTVLFKLIPQKLSEEILRTTTKWSSYEQLKDHLHSLQFLRTSGPAPMLQNMEAVELTAEEGETITTEDGELMRLERRDGKKVAVRANQQRRGGPKGQGKGNNDCYRCGRPGHRRADCTWSTHIDGGKPRPLPQRASTRMDCSNLEEYPEPTAATRVPEETAAKPLGHLIELNALDLGEEEDEDEYDPWEQGFDPWTKQLVPGDTSDEKLLCPPCDPMIPTLQDLYKAREVCQLCEKAGVYERMMQTQRHDLYIPTRPHPVSIATPFRSLSPQPVKVPIPSWVPDLELTRVELSSCIPEPPKPEELPRVLEPKPEELPSTRWNPPAQEPAREEYHDCEDDVPHATHTPEEAAVPETIEINAIGPTETHEPIDITVDSGAGAAVCNPKHFPESALVDSPGSLAGQIFGGPGGEKIPNMGQLKAETLLENGCEGKFVFQAADVISPLLAVSSVNDKGNLVLFDPQGSFIIPAQNQVLINKVRQLVQQMTGKIELHRKNGVYKMKAWRKKSGFTRQGR